MTPAYRRISTTIYIPLPHGRIGIGQIVEVDLKSLMPLSPPPRVPG